jgi:flagellar hook-length control protein FliK
MGARIAAVPPLQIVRIAPPAAPSVLPAPLEALFVPRRIMAHDAAAIAPALLAADPRTAHAVSQAADAQQPALDMRGREWIGTMIEQIEALRDAAPVRETRMRLTPEALGNVDISVRQDGDRVHVHFAADTPAARQLLAEAQPRLAEMADARGVRLGQTTVDGGNAGAGAGSGQREEEAPRKSQPVAPARARAEPSTSTDDRIA